MEADAPRSLHELFSAYQNILAEAGGGERAETNRNRLRGSLSSLPIRLRQGRQDCS
jgi:hypothetical protein